jgi:hypothetical protein
VFIIQIVEILWTKATRGAPRSNERASLPRSFILSGATGPYVVERHQFAEWQGFAPSPLKVEHKDALPGSEGVLRIAKGSDDIVRLGLLGTPNSGQPHRDAVADGLMLPPGSYGRLIVNARHTTYSGQYYSETVFNVTHGENVAADRFLVGEPDQILDLKANLF